MSRNLFALENDPIGSRRVERRTRTEKAPTPCTWIRASSSRRRPHWYRTPGGGGEDQYLPVVWLRRLAVVVEQERDSQKKKTLPRHPPQTAAWTKVSPPVGGQLLGPGLVVRRPRFLVEPAAPYLSCHVDRAPRVAFGTCRHDTIRGFVRRRCQPLQ